MVARHLSFAVPGSLDTPTGGYAYDRRVIAELRSLGWQVDVCDIGDGFPRPGTAGLAKAEKQVQALPASAPVVIDGLAFGVMNACAATLARTHRIVALVHHPLALETGVTPADAALLRRSETAALSFAKQVIVTSPQTADILVADYDVAREQITVALPGNDAMPLAQGSSDGICRLLSVGSIVPRKGYDVLVEALNRIPERSWHLTIAGDDTRNPETAVSLQKQIAEAKLGDRIAVTGTLSDAALADAYRHTDVFVTASHFEGYGMAATTAIASGLPVVATTGGALSNTVGAAGILVPPNDPDALAAALRQVIADPHARKKLRDASRAAAAKLPTWRDTATRFASAIEAVA